MRSRRAWLVAGGAVGLAVVVFVLVWFQPQKLFIDETVDEDLPQAAAPTAATPEAPEATASGPATRGSDAPAASETSTPPASPPAEEAPVVVSESTFRPLDHDASGTVELLRLADGRHVVRFEDLNVENGPDLRVYLSAAPADGPEDAIDDDFVDLGALKGNLGNQNYDVPPDVDITRYHSVSVWCRRFSTGFAVAAVG